MSSIPRSKVYLLGALTWMRSKACFPSSRTRCTLWCGHLACQCRNHRSSEPSILSLDATSKMPQLICFPAAKRSMSSQRTCMQRYAKCLPCFTCTKALLCTLMLLHGTWHLSGFRWHGQTLEGYHGTAGVHVSTSSIHIYTTFHACRHNAHIHMHANIHT